MICGDPETVVGVNVPCGIGQIYQLVGVIESV